MYPPAGCVWVTISKRPRRLPTLSIYSPNGWLCPLAGLIFFWCFSDNVISERTNVVYKFGPFRLEVREHRLVREGRSIPLARGASRGVRLRHGDEIELGVARLVFLLEWT